MLATDIYVLGLESSGTRFVSRSIAQAIDGTHSWDGERPACWKSRSGWHVHHISLPWGGTCDKSKPLKVVKSPNMCGRHPGGRWFADIVSILKGHPDRKAVIVVRDAEFTLPSVLKHHCFQGTEVALAEQHKGRELIQEALDSVPDQILLVHYESLRWYSKYTWKQVYQHLGIHSPHEHDLFKNGNPNWMNQCQSGHSLSTSLAERE